MIENRLQVCVFKNAVDGGRANRNTFPCDSRTLMPGEKALGIHSQLAASTTVEILAAGQAIPRPPAGWLQAGLTLRPSSCDR